MFSDKVRKLRLSKFFSKLFSHSKKENENPVIPNILGTSENSNGRTVAKKIKFFVIHSVQRNRSEFYANIFKDSEPVPQN